MVCAVRESGLQKTCASSAMTRSQWPERKEVGVEEEEDVDEDGAAGTEGTAENIVSDIADCFSFLTTDRRSEHSVP